MPLAHLVASFVVGHRHLEERRWAVAVDGLGHLRALPCEDRGQLPAGLQSELAFHEMSGGQPPRLLEAGEVFLFNLQLLEQPAGAPGWNDPVYLYGKLYGPWPAGAGCPLSMTDAFSPLSSIPATQSPAEAGAAPASVPRHSANARPTLSCQPSAIS